MRWLIITLCFSFSLSLHAQKGFEKEWKQVASFQKQGLPASVSALCEKIYKQAEKEKNFPQQLRAFLTRMSARTEIDRDSFYTDFATLEKWKTQTTDSLQLSVLAQVLSDQLIQYLQSNYYAIRQREETGDAPSGDLRKWTPSQFRSRCLALCEEAMARPGILSLTPTKTYSGLIKMGDASRYFLHDMYHLSGFHSVKIIEQLQNQNILPYTEASAIQDSIYSALLHFYTDQGNRSAALILSLTLLEVQKNAGELTDSVYRIRLDTLIQTNQDLDVCVEAYLQKATSLKNAGKYTETIALLDHVSKRYEHYDRINALKDLRNQIVRPVLSVELPRIAYPGERMKIKVNHKSLKGFTLRFYPISLDADDKKLNEYREKNFLKQYAKTPFGREYSLLPPADYHEKDTTFYLEAPEKGIYVTEVVTDPKNESSERRLLYVSSLKALVRKQAGNRETDIVVVDRKSGKPIPGATLSVYANQKGKFILSQTLTTDTKGECACSFQGTNGNYQIYAKQGNDKFLPELYVYNYFNKFTSDKTSESVKLLTDRGLYRPGQTVYVKGIAYWQEGDSTRVIPSRTYDLALLDANNNEVSQTPVSTNDWGSFTHSFTLPTRILSGNFQIKCGNNTAFIRVEEYKRPTFEVLIDTLRTAPQLGESVTLGGKAVTFSGFPLQNDSVSYTITREPRFPWGMRGMYPEIIASGTTRTDAQGHFSLTFNLEQPAPNTQEESAFRFRIKVDVTGAAGETQQGESSLIAGNRSLVISCDLPGEICRDSVLQVTARAENLNGTAVPAEIRVELFQKEGKQPLWSGSFEANKKITVNELDQLPSGEYRVKLSASDARNRPCKWEKEFTLFSMKDTRSPVQEPIWGKQMQTVFPQTGSAEILFATTEKDVYLMYDLFSGDTQLESRRFVISDTLMQFRLPYKKEYGEGVLLNVCFVKNGVLYQENFSIQKPLPQKKLTLKWEVFRDKLQPGQKEEWRLSIQNPNGTASQAELMASMYDASLDQIYPFNPNFLLNYSRMIPRLSWQADNEYLPRIDAFFAYKNLKYPAWSYDHWSIHLNLYARQLMGMRLAGTGEEVQVESAVSMDQAAVPGYNAAAKMRESATASDAREGKATTGEEEQATEGSVLEPNVNVRENFNETAFFYPQLHTNEKGEVSLSFTLPESLTKWRFIGIAHTKDVKTGMLQSDITTSKPFMLTANLPRYLRQGDVTGLAATIRNYSGTLVKGNVKCELFDPYSNQIIRKLRQPFTVQSDSTLAVFFELEPLKGYEVIGVRMIADGGTFSDGEQHLLALLSDKVHLVESIPLTLRGDGSKEYSLAPLFNHHSATATDRKITVEVTANPTWLAIQALPYLNNPTGDNAIGYATAYYANSLSEWIVNSNPTLKAALNAWKANPAPASSNLQRNSELKELLLEETPWVAQAENEAERRARLVALTDVNALDYQRDEALQRLKDLQLADGSFSWFKGMGGNASVTAYILETLGRLTVLTERKEKAPFQTIRNNAYGYLHKEMTRFYNGLKDKNNYQISEWALNYLYLCTLTQNAIPSENKKAYDFYLNALRPSLTNLSIRGRATAVLVLLHANRKSEADAFYRSLKEYAVGNEEMGSFYANSGLYDATSTLTQAIEAAQAMDDAAFAEELKLNLLRRKQTQMWNSPVSTANAIYALLKGEGNLISDTGACSVTLGKQVIRSQSAGGDADALMGYAKVSFTGKETQAKNAVFTRTGKGISWGAIYGECMEQMDRVKEQGVQVKIEKELFVRRQTGSSANGGISWEKVTDTTVLRTGDQIMTRLAVTADREMDFVTIKDQRAACLEPIQQLSGYRKGGYFINEKDASSNLFFDKLPKGTHLFEIESYVTRSGIYNSGIATLQSAYATEFSGHSASETLTVNE